MVINFSSIIPVAKFEGERRILQVCFLFRETVIYTSQELALGKLFNLELVFHFLQNMNNSTLLKECLGERIHIITNVKHLLPLRDNVKHFLKMYTNSLCVGN